MADMSPEEMQALQEQAGKGGGEDVTKMAQDLGRQMEAFYGILDGAEGITPANKDQMKQLIMGYADLVQKLMSEAPGQDSESCEPVPNQVPADQGMGGVPMNPQTRN